MNENTSEINYINSPLVEVVCGVSFKSLDSLTVPYVGLFWDEFRHDFPKCQELPPLLPISNLEQNIELEFSNVPLLPRLWFFNLEKNKVIQLQRDRFIFNWRKSTYEGKYPNYPMVFNNFNKYFLEFKNFIDKNNLGNVEPIQYEMRYINQLKKGKDWNTIDDIKNIFPNFNLSNIGDSINLESFNWQSVFSVSPNLGKLSALIRLAKNHQTGEHVVLFELSFTGSFTDSFDKIQLWFDSAHKYLIDSFSILTSKDMQENIWRKI